MKSQRGFTLIEILVVLVIIAMLVSMAAINTGGDPRKDQLINEAERLKFFLEAVSDEALFQNKDIGFEVTKSKLTPFSYEEAVATNGNSGSANSSSASSKTEYEWVPYKGRFTDVFELSMEEMLFLLKVDGQAVILDYAQEKSESDKPKPQFYVKSSGEQSVVSFEVSIEDLEFSVTTRGMGVGRFYVDINSEE